jgi:hypothetical protein
VFALVVDGQIRSTGSLPRSARRLDTQEWVMGLASAGTVLQEACGYMVVVEPPRPPITALETFDPDTFQLLVGVPTRIYHVRNKTQAELDAEAAAVTAEAERDDARAAIAQLDTFLAIGTPTNAQVLAVVRLLARVAKRLIRDAIGT